MVHHVGKRFLSLIVSCYLRVPFLCRGQGDFYDPDVSMDVYEMGNQNVQVQLSRHFFAKLDSLKKIEHQINVYS